MKLKINKFQTKGLIGKPSFEVRPEIELSEEERELIRHYKLQHQILLSRKLTNIFGKVSNNEVSVTVDQLLGGDVYKCKDLDEVISYTDSLVEAYSCDTSVK